MRRKKKLFPFLDVIKGKILLYVKKGILWHYYDWPDTKLDPGIVEIRRIT